MESFRAVSPRRPGLGSGGAPPAYVASSAHFILNSRIRFTGSAIPFVNGTQATISFWIRPTSLTNASILQSRDGGSGHLWRLNVAGVYDFAAQNTSSVTVAAGTSTAQLFIGGWFHYLLSFDLTDTAKRWVYINGIQASTGTSAAWTVYNTAGTMALLHTDLYVGADDSLGADFVGELAEIWMKQTYIDLSVLGNRQLFLDYDGTTGRPQDLGSDGSTPGLGVPELYMRFLTGFLGKNSGSGGATGTLLGATDGATSVEFTRGGSAWFDGIVDRLRFTGSAVTMPVGKEITISCWFRVASVGGTRCIMSCRNPGANPEWRLAIVSNDVNFYAQNASSTNILFVDGNTVIGTAQWYHILLSVDLSDVGKRHLYINDISSVGTWTTYTNDTMALDRTALNIGANDTAGNTFAGYMAHIWVDHIYRDFSIAGNRQKFVDLAGDPVNLGSDGSTPFGTAPDLYLPFPVGANFAVNVGADGGTATIDGDVIAGTVTAGY